MTCLLYTQALTSWLVLFESEHEAGKKSGTVSSGILETLKEALLHEVKIKPYL